ncbi:hypothetical protein HMPREF9057_02015 [Actinomyces sp. oral taxon 171 str. F0337]|nr:hypothetical protein HMPREF9057_02015 [Actinomyces sp. oral taxon 171 str. F0337]
MEARSAVGSRAGAVRLRLGVGSHMVKSGRWCGGSGPGAGVY